MHDLCCGARGAYRYQVQSSRDIRDHWGSTHVLFDAETGELLQLWLPTGRAAGDILRMWLTSLHMAAAWGLPLRIFMTVVGLLVPVLLASSSGRASGGGGAQHSVPGRNSCSQNERPNIAGGPR